MDKKPVYPPSLMEPVNDRIVVRRQAVDAKSKGGIIYPENYKPHARLATVIAAGPGAWQVFGETPQRYPMQCKVGDTVLLPNANELVTVLLDAQAPSTEVSILQDSAVLSVMHEATDV